jgi:2',3'-cyclic-nucleotide 2'-phosphodiesterase (5'-nucleotidase family)
MELCVCDVIQLGKLDTSFDVMVNETVVTSAFREQNCGFHKVIINIPEKVVRKGKNDVVIRLSKESITPLFLRYVSLKVNENEREDSVMLAMTSKEATLGFTLTKQQGSCYRNDLKSWCLQSKNGFMEFELDVDNAREFMLGLELCSGAVNGKMDCPIDILVNDAQVVQGFDKKDWAFREYSFAISKDKLKKGKNKIRVVLQNTAKTCMFIKSVKIGERDKTITFITTNDIHGRFLGEGIDFAKLAAYKEQMKENGGSCLLVDSGDPTQGTPFAIFDKGLSTMELMNKVGYDIVTIGNHEFDNITNYTIDEDELSQNIRAFKGDFISSNVNCDSGDNRDNYIHTILGDKNGSWCLRGVDGLNLLFIGFTTPDISMDVPRMKGFQIDDIATAGKNASAIVAKLREHIPVDVVVAVSHLGSKKENADYATLAQSFPEVDIILDGHSHEIYTVDVDVKNGEKDKKVKVIQSDCYATHYGIVTLKFRYDILQDVDTKVFEASTINQMNFDESDKYKDTKSYIEQKQKQVDEKFGSVRSSMLSHTLWGGALDEDKPYPALKAVNIARYVQTNMGVLTAEAMVWDACNCEEVKKNPNMYIVGGINGGGVRDSVSLGKQVRDYDLFSVLPSQLVSEDSAGYRVFEFTLSTLKAVLENSISAISVVSGGYDVLVAGGGCFLNSCGMEYTIQKKDNKLSIGDEIVLKQCVNGTNAEQKFSFSKDGSQKLLICMEKYISSGGDGYVMMENQTVVKSSDIALFTTAGKYIYHLCSGKEFDYPPVMEDITYEGFSFANQTKITATVVYQEKILKNEKISYCFYTSKDKFGSKTDVTTDSNGKIQFIRPDGPSVLCVWIKDRYLEVFMHSYFEVTNRNSITLNV